VTVINAGTGWGPKLAVKKATIVRFPAVQPLQPRRPSPAPDFVRRLVTSLPLQQDRNDQPKRQELPLDPDQRVRLVGEW
jgi:hypothetical protein